MIENNINSLNRIFTRNMVHQFIDGKVDSTYRSAVKRYVNCAGQKNNGELISDLYSELHKNYRNEYYYKNTLLNKLLLGIHSPKTTTVLTELGIADSKADFVMINGKAVVYEIKTELDNLDRLASQINDYYKAFDHVAVVTYEANLNQLHRLLNKINKPVGIYVLNKNESLTTIQIPEIYNKCLDKEIIFKLLRKKEYENIISYYFGYLPDTTQFRYYSECKKLFLEIPIENSYNLVLKEIKKRIQINKEKLDKVPYELKFLAYFMELKNDDYKKLDNFLGQKYGGI